MCETSEQVVGVILVEVAQRTHVVRLDREEEKIFAAFI